MKNIASIYDRLMGFNQHSRISNGALKELVIRDLLCLLNTNSYYADKHTNISTNQTYSSVLNYGIHPLSGKRASEINWTEVETNIQCAIKTFEPRIIPQSLEVKCLIQDADSIVHNQVSIEISGMVRSSPYPEKFILHTNLDLETGNFNLL